MCRRDEREHCSESEQDRPPSRVSSPAGRPGQAPACAGRLSPGRREVAENAQGIARMCAHQGRFPGRDSPLYRPVSVAVHVEYVSSTGSRVPWSSTISDGRVFDRRALMSRSADLATLDIDLHHRWHRAVPLVERDNAHFPATVDMLLTLASTLGLRRIVVVVQPGLRLRFCGNRSMPGPLRPSPRGAASRGRLPGARSPSPRPA